MQTYRDVSIIFRTGNDEGWDPHPIGVQQDADFRWPVVEIPELVPLLDQFDCIMARGNGWSFEVICLNNRVSDRSAPMRVSLEKLRQIGRGCFKYANSINGEQLPVRFQVWELIDAADPNNNRSEELCERVSLKNKTGISYWSLNTSTLGVRTNERFNGFFAGRRNAEHALVSALAGEMPTPIKEVQIGTPY